MFSRMDDVLDVRLCDESFALGSISSMNIVLFPGQSTIRQIYPATDSNRYSRFRCAWPVCCASTPRRSIDETDVQSGYNTRSGECDAAEAHCHDRCELRPGVGVILNHDLQAERRVMEK